jgi:hypothetical protein
MRFIALQGSFLHFIIVIPNGSLLTITQDQSHCCIAVIGGFEFVAEIGEQLGWSGSLRWME